MFGWFAPRLSPSEMQEERERVVQYLRAKLPELRKLKRKAKDKFGVFVESRWAFQKEMFSQSSVRNELKDLRGHKWRDMQALIDEVMEGRQEPQPSMSGHEYEAVVAAELRAQGWTVEQTAGSGDHGVDLVATKDRLRVAIQCKRFKGTVGTTAVQAVVGGCAFYQASRTAVVTTGTFTPAAIELATVTRTVLLEHADLPRLHSMLLA